MERKTSEVTRTPFGRDLVELLTFGCIQYMLDHRIPLTQEGFQQLVVIAQTNGLKGRIAFGVYEWTQQRMQALFVQRTGTPFRPFDAQRMAALDSRPTFHRTLRQLGLGPDNDRLGDAKQRQLLDVIREYLGPDAADVIEALRVGDCQRDLVWQRISQIVESGDPVAQLNAFRMGPVGKDNVPVVK